MKVYFISTPRGKVKLGKNYRAIFQTVTKLGCKHVTKFILDVNAERFYLSDISKFYSQTINDIKQADICIFEVSTHSLTIGHLIGLSIGYGKPVIALYVKGNEPFFLGGVDNEKVQVLEYDLPSLKLTLKEAIRYAAEQQDVRFNFFISPRIQQYLDWISKHKRTPRSVYLRSLLEKDMKENKEWRKQK